MANIYCQVQGKRKFVLFPPSDVGKLSLKPGASSSSLDVFSSLGDSPNLLQSTSPLEATLGPGDVLFLPPFWLHTAAPVARASVAVNVFFRSLEHGYSTGRDVYGNKDLAAYEKGRQALAKIASSFDGLQPDARAFYLARLAEELALASRN